MRKLKNLMDFQQLKKVIEKRREPSALSVTVCCGTGCTASGARDVFTKFQEEIKAKKIEATVTSKATGCHGFCERGPLVVIFPDRIFYQRVSTQDVPEIVEKTLMEQKVIDRLLYVDPLTGEKITYEPDVQFYKKQERIIFGTNGMIDPTNIDDYIGVGGYEALTKVLSQNSSGKVIDEIKKSGLRGRGGAGFPTGRKWEITRSQSVTPKYIICNADEGDPGAFQDRSLCEGNPHSILEGMIIGAYAIGANEGYIYVRAEYPLACKHLEIAIRQAEEYGFLGGNTLGSDFSFKIHIKRGAGAFVCGEESALIASIEGRPGEPIPRPPYPAEKGLWGKPTNINNVKTWASVPYIINRGAEWFSSIGTEKSKGTMIFSLVGKVNNTGLVEVPMGMTLRDMVYEIGGGIPGGKRLKAIQTGGPSGGCIPWELTTIPVDYEELSKVGSMMGSGGCVVMDEDNCMVDIAKYFLSFTMAESCGKCTPCREGNARLLDILTKISEGEGDEADLELLEELAETIIDGSLCALGKTAPNPVLTTLKYFKDEYLAHIKYKRCPASVCKAITPAPCQSACLIEQSAPAYIAYVAQGKLEEAFDVITKENPLPAICGRVCPHPCEPKCKLRETTDPIAIMALKRFVTDYVFEKELVLAEPKEPVHKEKVAVVGGGPAGLSCAYFLANYGYKVTIFEALPFAGGMLKVGIPEFRLPRKVIDKNIEFIKNYGVEIKLNAPINDPEKLLENGHNAVFVATGAYSERKLGVEGENLKGIYYGIDFLKKVNSGEKVEIGEKVAVIGGGNSAVDAARTVLRLGAKEVTIVYRRSRAEMPAFEEEIIAAEEEGVNILYLTTPTKMLGEEKVTAMQCIKMELGTPDDSGRRRPIPIEGSEFMIEVDTVIPTIGQSPDLSFLPEDTKLKKTRWNTLVVDEETLQTPVQGIFAGGDVVSGPSTVLEAIATARKAAKFIHKYLRGEPIIPKYEILKPSVYVEPLELSEAEVEELMEARRPKMPCLSVTQRKNNFREAELGFTKEMSMKEAMRCLRCDLESKKKMEKAQVLKEER